MTVRIFFETQEAADLLNQLRRGRPRTFSRRDVDQVLSTFRRPNAPAPVASVVRPVEVPAVVPSAPPVVAPSAAPPTKAEPPVVQTVSPPAAVKAEPAKPAARPASASTSRPRRPRAARADEVADTLGSFFNATSSSLLEFEKAEDAATVLGGATLTVAEAPAPPAAKAPVGPAAPVVEVAPVAEVASVAEAVETGEIVAMGQVDALRLSIRTSANQQHAGVRTETSAGFFQRVLKKEAKAEAKGDLSLVGGGLTLDAPPAVAPAPPAAKAPVGPPASVVEVAPVAETVEAVEMVLESGEVVPFGQIDTLRLSVRTGAAQQHAGVRPESSAGFFRRVLRKAEAPEGEQRIGTRDANNVVSLEESEFLDPDVALPEPTPEPSLAELVKKPSVPAGVRTETTSGFFRRVVGQAG